MNKLARPIKKWTKACDKRLNRLISYIHHTSAQTILSCGKYAEQCRLGLFQDSDFAGDLEDSKSTFGGTLCIFGSHSFVPISWMCKKQNAVSHSSTESEIISLDTGLGFDGLLALELRDLIVSVSGSVSQIPDRTEQPVNDVKKHQKSQKRSNVMENIDSVPSNVQSSRQETLPYVFENNEAVIMMIIKGRKHVSRHRVALDWLFDRINLDPKIQTHRHQEPTCRHLDKGNHFLLCLLNISHFSSTVCSAAMTKRSQQVSGEERVTAKSRPMMNLIARTSSFVSSSTSSSPGKTWCTNIKILGNHLLEKKDQGDLVKEQIYSKPLIITTMNNSWRASQQHIIQNRITILLGFLKNGKSEATTHDRSGKPDNINSQEMANSQNFIMESDSTEFELYV